MARANLGTLLSVANDSTTTQPEPAAEPQVAPEAAPATPPVPEKAATSSTSRTRRTGAAGKRRGTAAASQPAMHFTEYERVEARLRDDQVIQLDALVRRLNKQRAGGGERITRNTLLRVASDMLLAQTDAAAGGTEAEIRTSVLPD